MATMTAAASLLLAGCGYGSTTGARASGDPTEQSTPSTPPQAASATPLRRGDDVLVAAKGSVLGIGGGLTLCTGMIAASLPPAGCSGPSLGLGAIDVTTLPGYTHYEQGTITTDTIGVVGWWNGTKLTVAKIVAADAIAQRPPQFTTLDTACADPGGADVPTPSVGPSGPIAGDEAVARDAQAAIAYANAQNDLGQVWYSANMYVVNAAFTGDIDRHRAEMRKLYAGPLCVVKSKYAMAHLRQLQESLGMTPRGANGNALQLTSSGATLDELQVSLLYATEADIAALRASTIPELRVTQELTPVPAGSPLAAGLG